MEQDTLRRAQVETKRLIRITNENNQKCDDISATTTKAVIESQKALKRAHEVLHPDEKD